MKPSLVNVFLQVKVFLGGFNCIDQALYGLTLLWQVKKKLYSKKIGKEGVSVLFLLSSFNTGGTVLCFYYWE